MTIQINDGLDLSVHMKIIISLTDSIHQVLEKEPGMEHLSYTMWLQRLYLESINKSFQELKINID